jgi:uncharacterized protein YdcH (DUF465 family)
MDKKKTLATLQDVDDSVAELAGMCSNQFTRIDQRFDQMATKAELRMEIDGLYHNMVRRFDAVDARFERVDERFDSLDKKMDTFILFMRGHEKRIERLERSAAFA